MTLLQLDVPFVATSLTNVTVTAPPQLSVAVTEPMLGAGTAEKHCTVAGPGQVIDGGVVSFTVIVCVQVFWLPQASVALVGPGDHVVAARRAVRGHVAQERHRHGAAAVVGGGDRADARRRHQREALDSSTRPGHVSVGGVVSLTVMVCVQVA